MAASGTRTNIPSDNPLAHDNYKLAMSKAEAFWTHHKLGDIVDKDDFVKGVLVFSDLKGAREFEESSPRHTDEYRQRYVKKQKLFAELSPRQNTSLRLYTRRTQYIAEHEADAIVKRLFFALGDTVAYVIKGKPNGVEDKSLWDYMKTFSTAQWQIFCTCCLAALTQGWDQSSMNGANIAWPADLNVDITTTSGIYIFGWLNAAPFCIGALVGSLLTDPLINAGFGRRWAITLGGWFSLIPCACTLFVTDWKGFMACRILLGVGMGAKASIVPIYISEIAPESIRGRMSMCWQLFDTLGILAGSIVNYIIYCYTQSKPSWRIMISISSIPALLFLTLILFCVESPRWLIKKNRYREALSALIILHQLPSPIIACGELYMIFRRLEAEETGYLKVLEDRREAKKKKTQAKRTSTVVLEGQENVQLQDLDSSGGHTGTAEPISQSTELGSAVPSSSANDQVTEASQAQAQNEDGPEAVDKAPMKLQELSLSERINLLRHVKHMRRALRASLFVMAAQQACGINVLALMSTIIFAKAMADNGGLINLTEASQVQRALEFSIYFGLANHLPTFFPFFLIDGRRGRRTLLKYTFPLMAISLFLSGAGLFLRSSNPRAGPKMFEAFTILFTVFFSVGEGPAAFVISSEVFPLIVRELGMSLAVFVNFILAAVLSFCIPHGLTRAANSGSFWMAFGGLNLILWILSLLFVYETSGEKLEGINTKYDKSWKEESELGKWISGLRGRLRGRK